MKLSWLFQESVGLGYDGDIGIRYVTMEAVSDCTELFCPFWLLFRTIRKHTESEDEYREYADTVSKCSEFLSSVITESHKPVSNTSKR